LVKENSDFILVDSGNLLFKRTPDKSNKSFLLLTARGITKAYQAMSYEAVAPSSNDLSAGPDFIVQSQSENFPWVSANVTDAAGKLIFPPYIIKQTKDLSIGIIGLTGADSKPLDYFIVGDWKEPLQAQITELRNRCDMLVVLSNLTNAENTILAEDFPQIDIVISAISNKGKLSPKVLHKALITQTESRGKYLGKLEIDWHRNGKWAVNNPKQSLEHLKRRLRAIDLQIEKLYLQQETNATLAKKIARMESYRKTMLSQIESLESYSAETSNHTVQNRYISAFVPVKPVTSESNVATIVRETKMSISSFNRSRKTAAP